MATPWEVEHLSEVEALESVGHMGPPIGAGWWIYEEGRYLDYWDTPPAGPVETLARELLGQRLRDLCARDGDPAAPWTRLVPGGPLLRCDGRRLERRGEGGEPVLLATLAELPDGVEGVARMALSRKHGLCALAKTEAAARDLGELLGVAPATWLGFGPLAVPIPDALVSTSPG